MSSGGVKTEANSLNEKEEFAMKPNGEFRRLMKLFTRRWIFLLAGIMALICGVMPTVMNLLMGDMVNIATGETKGDFIKQVQKVIIKLICYVIGFSVAMCLQHFLTSFSGPFFVTDVRQHLYTAMMKKDIPFFDATQTGTLIGRLSHDCTICNEIYITKTITAVQNLCQSAAGIILALVTAWRVTLVVMIAYPLAALVFWLCERWIARLWEDFNKSATNATTKAEEVISSFRTVKSFDQELREAESYRKSLDEITAVFNKTSYIQGVKDSGIEIILNCVIMVFWYFGCWIIARKPHWGMVNGDLMVLQMSLIFAVIGVSQALALSDDFKKARVSAAKILEITDPVPDIDQRAGPNQFPDGHTTRGTIEFRDVSFRYATQDKYAVQHLSFTINAGETVALIGESGCGKSTTLQLLQRFYEIESGEILLDGVDIRSLSPKFLREQIAIVPQGPVLYSMSIKENVRYAKPNANDAETAEAARTGNAHNFIMELPDNYNTQVGPISLSGGQKQRICISRAILAGAPILLLDEATAALDTESEQLVQQSLDRVRHGKTAISVAHRLATVINSDRILVFKEGHIEEEGTHEELLAKNGIYADLVRFQLQ